MLYIKVSHHKYMLLKWKVMLYLYHIQWHSYLKIHTWMSFKTGSLQRYATYSYIVVAAQWDCCYDAAVCRISFPSNSSILTCGDKSKYAVFISKQFYSPSFSWIFQGHTYNKEYLYYGLFCLSTKLILVLRNEKH